MSDGNAQARGHWDLRAGGQTVRDRAAAFIEAGVSGQVRRVVWRLETVRTGRAGSPWPGTPSTQPLPRRRGSVVHDRSTGMGKGPGVACYPLNQEARRAHAAALAGAAPPPHPEPEVRVRPAQQDEVPRGARTLENAARKAGWWTATKYARGTTKYANGRPGKVVDQLTLLGQRDWAYFAAWWHDGAFDSAVAHVPDGAGLRRINARALRALIAAPASSSEATAGASINGGTS